MYEVIESGTVSNDQSLLGTMHMLSHNALILRHRARHESHLAQTASKIHELAYSGMALIDYHPKSTTAHSEEDTLANKLRKIEELLRELKADESAFLEIGQIRDYLTKACTLALGRPSAAIV
jgi:hypothetical protein